METYRTKDIRDFDASSEAVTSHFKPILFARNQVVEIIRHGGGWVSSDISPKKR